MNPAHFYNLGLVTLSALDAAAKRLATHPESKDHVRWILNFVEQAGIVGILAECESLPIKYASQIKEKLKQTRPLVHPLEPPPKADLSEILTLLQSIDAKLGKSMQRNVAAKEVGLGGLAGGGDSASEVKRKKRAVANQSKSLSRSERSEKSHAATGTACNIINLPEIIEQLKRTNEQS